MENIRIDGTKNSPEVNFDFQSNVFGLAGKSYMEDANGFFRPIFEDFSSHLASLDNATVVFNFQMTYFNSSSARYVLRIFDQLDEAAKNGNKVSIFWYYDEDDGTMEEHGEEFGEDLEHAVFEMKKVLA